MSTKFLAFETNSFHTWDGIGPKKFSGGIKCFEKKSEMKSIASDSNESYLPLEKFSDNEKFQPCLKTFEEHNVECEILEKLNIRKPPELNQGLKHIKFKPSNKKLRCEMLHIQPNASKHYEDASLGIKTFPDTHNKKSMKSYSVENVLGQRKLIYAINEQRNYLPMTSLGDKPYKHPTYQTDFYKMEGLVPQQKYEIRKKTSNARNADFKNIQIQKMTLEKTWKYKVEKEEKDQDEKAVEYLDKWIETTLKEANPKYRDPDDVELPDIKPTEPKKQAPTTKDAKKGKK